MNNWGWRDEGCSLRRETPQMPYKPGAAVLEVPMRAVTLTFQLFAAYARRGVEAGCFWYGSRDDRGNAQVLAVVVPKQRNRWGNYHVSAEAMEKVAAATQPHAWKNLAQVHTHPGTDVEHSRYDDEHANSRRALSFVLPLYGRDSASWPSQVGVHEFQGGYWHLLNARDMGQRVRSSRAAAEVNFIDLR